MRLVYLFDGPELNGGNKVAIEHAQALADLGHEVWLFANGPRPQWIELTVPWLDYSRASVPDRSWDAVICTYWTSLEIARRLGLGPLVHFCQGYEASFPHLLTERPAILAAYDQPLPTLTITRHLAGLVASRHGRACRVVSPIWDQAFEPRFRLRPRQDPWIAVPGIFEAELKGVETALDAIRQLRAGGRTVRTLRISTYPLTAAEQKVLAPDRFLTGVPPSVVARELPRCDLLLFPSQPEEGFGLPLLEAMSAKVPVVSTDIPSAREIGGEAFTFVPPGDSLAMAMAAGALLSDPARWRRARRLGRAALGRFEARPVARELEAALTWAVQEAAQPIPAVPSSVAV